MRGPREGGRQSRARLYDEEVVAERRLAAALILYCTLAPAQSHSPPAGIRPARIGRAVSILPGGRVIAPAGEQYRTGWEPVALAVSASGKTAVTVNRDSRRPSLTVIEHDQHLSVRQLPAAPARLPFELAGRAADDRWPSLAGGLAFSGEHSVFVSEGNTGRVASIDLETEEPHRALTLDTDGITGSITGDLALDAPRNILYVADLAHARIVALDTRSRRAVGRVALSHAPLLVALAPDHRKLYVAGTANWAASPEKTGSSVTVVDVAQPGTLRVQAVIPTSERAGGILARADRVFISDPDDDSVTVIGAASNQVEARIAIRIPGLENFRGVSPAGLAYDPLSGWLLVAETGVNAVAVIDPGAQKVLGHIPVGWCPSQVTVDRSRVYVTNLKGQGAGATIRENPGPAGSVSIFELPKAADLPADTQFVMQANGFVPRPGAPRPLPTAIRHVVLIVKQSRAFDEVLGDLTQASNGTVMALPQLARFGRDGYVDGQRERLSLHHLNVTPNHHAIAARWAFSDNFYADAETNEAGMRWLSVSSHLARHGVSLYRFAEPFDPEVADTGRAQSVIAEINERFAKPGADLPQFVMIQLPNDRMAPARPEARYPYRESYLADNDLALGRILEFLSGTRWWDQMAVFVTESSAEDGIDHIDTHRTLLFCAGPWARKDWVTHANTSFPGLLRTIFRLLGVPPLNLHDVSAADLSDCFTTQPDAAPYRAVPVDPRLYRSEP